MNYIKTYEWCLIHVPRNTAITGLQDAQLMKSDTIHF